MAKKIELTKQGKLDLINWAVNYYNENNLGEEEQEGVEITEINQPIDEQKLKDSLGDVIEKLESVASKLEETLDWDGYLNSRDEKEKALEKQESGIAFSTVLPGLGLGVVDMIVMRLNQPNIYSSLAVGALMGGAITLCGIALFNFIKRSIRYSIYNKQNKQGNKIGLGGREYELKKKMDKKALKVLKQAKKEGKDITIAFDEDDYTYLFLKQLLHELRQEQAGTDKLLEVTR